MDKHKKIAVLMGGRSREREVSLRTGAAILRALQALGYTAEGIDVGADFIRRIPNLTIDVAFLALHGPFGEDGRMQSLLEWQGIPYTGSGVLTSALCAEKDALKMFLTPYKVPMAKGWSYRRLSPKVHEQDLRQWVNAQDFDCPLMVKPNSEGSSIGSSRVFRRDDLLPALIQAAEIDTTVLVEEYIRGREVTVSVLNGKALPLLEVIPEGGFYDYKAKYQSKTTVYRFPDDLSATMLDRVQLLSEQIFAWIRARGAVRIDWMLRETGEPIFLEVNTTPGMTETSLLPKAALKAGLSFDALVERILSAVA